jgi:hypothetical protein
MAILGIRCSNTDYCYSVFSGVKKDCSILEKKEVLFPKGFTRPQQLKWFLQEIEDILGRFDIRAVSIKVSEAMATRNAAFVDRVENEAIIQLAAINNGIKAVYKKVKCTIAKDFGLKGRAKYLARLDYSPVPEFDTFSPKLQEAVLAGWSSLP